MLSDEILEKIVERLAVRLEETNTYILKEIATNIGKFRTLNSSDAQKLAQMIKFGGDYNKIAKELARVTKLNVADIYKIFEEVAKEEYAFAEQFYKYRNKGYISWNKNKVLRDQVKALAKVGAEEYAKLTKTMAFATHDANGKVVYTELSKMYNDVLDRAVLSVGQGKASFDTEMFRVIKELAMSGIRTVDYENNKSLRVDTAVRMQMRGALRNLHNETQRQFGQEFDADGVEISVHENPAPDHEEVQGRQFRLKEFDKLQEEGVAKDYTNHEINIHRTLKDGTITKDYRPISTLNCYHYIFNIVLGVNKPLYTDKQLQEIIDRNEEGFDFEGKHYTMYEGTQLQRKLETEIRKQKDAQIMARKSHNEEGIYKSQKAITTLTNKYNELSKVSRLPTKIERMRVDGYHKIKVIRI